MIRTVRDHLQAALEIVYPRSCGGCGAAGEVICGGCRDSFRFVSEPEACPICGAWLGIDQVCGGCTGRRHPFERGWFGFYFEGALREALLAFKFKARKDVGRRLVRLVNGKLDGLSGVFDIIVPLPVTAKRLRERGFNQSYIIAEEIGKITGGAVRAALAKVRPTKDQFTLSREERRRNVRGAFAVETTDEVRHRRVLLVDDLFTTGATAREASRVLKSAGAEKVFVFALARTPR